MLGVYWQAELGDGGAPDPRLAALGRRWIGTVSDDDQAVDDAWRRHRLALGVPEGRAELGDVLWLEANADELNGVSFAKGLLRRAGEHRAHELAAEGSIAGCWWCRSIARTRNAAQVAYPELGYAVDHLRVEDADPALLPAWLGPG